MINMINVLSINPIGQSYRSILYRSILAGYNMINPIFFMASGALAFYLYQNPGEMDSVISQGKDLVNQGAVIVQEHTK